MTGRRRRARWTPPLAAALLLVAANSALAVPGVFLFGGALVALLGGGSFSAGEWTAFGLLSAGLALAGGYVWAMACWPSALGWRGFWAASAAYNVVAVAYHVSWLAQTHVGAWADGIVLSGLVVGWPLYGLVVSVWFAWRANRSLLATNAA